ncbi:MAG: 4-aminobutyrate--2-oxoglutarate transaminase [Actinomycetales bacterium]
MTDTAAPATRSFAGPGPASQALAARKTAAVAAGVGAMMPTYISRGAGAILTDVDGNELLDFGAGIAVNSIGHSHPKVVQAIQDAAARITHTCFMVSPYEEYVAVCERLQQLTPGSHDKKAALFNSGAEAVENAVKIARLATGRDAVAVFDHAYHGRTNLTMAMTAKVVPYKKNFGPFAGEVYRAPMSYPYREPTAISGEDAARRAIGLLDKQVGAGELAAVVIEPIQGEGGFIVPAPGFLPTLAAWCRENGVVFVADEIQTGFCRTGAMFASEHEAITPDLMTVAKGIAGGMPLAAVVGRADLMDAVHPGGLGGTYGGNPVACAAGLAAMDVFVDEDLAGRAREIEATVKTTLQETADRHTSGPRIGEIRGRGAMIAIEFVKDDDKTPDPETTAAVAKRAQQAGVITLTCGTYSNIVRLLPPMVITDTQLEDGLAVLTEAIDATLG